ncbi:MAG: FtsX-like permease family protein [Oscillospiraceae bacterium]|nr:FtsX-like permease family protein [Oscillospiraceae bacterium]
MKAINKNTIREISKTKNRFLSILLICAIGVGFFSGVRAACDDMKTSADNYYDQNDLFDLRVLSTFGLTENDKKALLELDEVDGVFTSKYTDLSMLSGEHEYLTRVYSAQSGEINRIEITEGRNIQNEGECIISGNFLKGGIVAIGDKITLEDLTDAEEFPLSKREYTVVGLYNTPMFISITQRGSTNIGDGALDAFMIVDEADFTQDVFTEIYVKSEKLKNEKSYSDEYKEFRDKLSDKLEELGVKQSEIRTREVLEEPMQKLLDGEKELEEAKIDGQKELDDAKEELEDAKKKIEDGEKELEDAKKKIDDGRIELEDAERKLAEALEEINDGKAELEDAKRILEDSEKQLDDAQDEIDGQRALLEYGKAELEAAKAELNEQLALYEAAVAQLDQQEQQLIFAEQMGVDVSEARIKLEAAKAVLAENKALLDAGFAQIEENEKTIAEGERALDDAQRQVSAGYYEYNKGLKEYNEGAEKIADAEKQYNEGYAEFSEKKAEFEQGVKDYEDGVKEIEDAKKQYEDGLKEYEDGVREFNEKIADAEKEIEDAKKELADVGEAEWYIFTRDDNVGYAEYESNAERINKISNIFPIFFLLVAGLVCLTTMSRMVEEQRTQIGTLKALGYSNGAIVRHYMIYAVSGAFVGGIVGAFIGCVLFPWVIMYAYSIMYNIKDFTFLFAPDNIILSCGAMTAAIAVTVYFSCRKALEETPASLMRPKAPKAGKRILLEKITFIWNHMNFFAKISGRNLFRYKRRMFMTVVGIAGCTALSLTGFGLKDSISDIVDLQYKNIFKYSGYLAYDEDADSLELQSVYDDMLGYNPDTNYTRALIKQYETKFDGKNVQCYVTAVEDTDIFESFVDIHERVSREKVYIKDGAVITEKAAKLLGAKVGDEIELSIGGGKTEKLIISGITEHYTSHYLYIDESKYEEIFGEAPKYNIIYFENGISGDNKTEVEKFSEIMLKNENVLAVMMNATSLNEIKETLSIMDMVTIVLIVSAGALALVVLYNLSNVNITERIREIATLKVLGFYDAEVSSYVFRENIVLSMMGGAVGLLLGWWLCMFVITTAEIDEVMFGREIHPISYLWAFLVTIGFSLLVNLIMTRTLKRISMVESLKSVE